MRSFSSETARFIPMVVAASALVACSHSQPAPEAPPVAQSASPAAAPAPEKAPPPAVGPIASVSIYFGVNSTELDEGARMALTRLASQAQSQPHVDLRIEGNCDERGSRVFNLALGKRRAEAAKDYLVFLGVDASRITAVSNGKDKPRARGHGEQVWKKNRRDDLMPAPRAVAQASH
ncbi:MAG TPA: OmpA family protein [Myxococcales bacterium]|nr:OmpA family protein [Myxococcales bacterium]